MFPRNYNIPDCSTLHLVLRLRGQGDMLSNHVTSKTPYGVATSLDAPICVTFDADVRSADASNAFRVEVISRGAVGAAAVYSDVSGAALYSEENRILTFVPEECALKPGSEYDFETRQRV